MGKVTFTNWLARQEHRQDATGHLARVWAEFTPGRISSVAGVTRVLREIADRAPDGPAATALIAMDEAVAGYEHRDDPRPALSAVPDAGPGRADGEGAEPSGSPPLVPFTHDAQGYPAGASALAHQIAAQGARFPAAEMIPAPAEHASADGYSRSRPDVTRWQVTSAPQGTLEGIGDMTARLLGMVSLIAATLGISPDDAADAVAYAGARDIAPHLPAIRRALEFAAVSGSSADSGPYLEALAALFPADYGTQDPEIVLTGDDRMVPDEPLPDPDDFAGLWAAADFSEAGA